MVKNIIFDLGGVLLDLDRQKVIDSFEEMGCTEADELLNNFLQKGIFMELEMGTASRYRLYDHIRRFTGKDIPSLRIDDALNNFISWLEPYKLDLLDKLSGDYRLFVLSNTNEIMIPEIDRIWFGQKGRRMRDYFEAMFLSYEMKLLKPDPAIFEQVAIRAAIRPEETLFLDDGPRNVEAAERLGFITCQPLPGEDLRRVLIDRLKLPDDYFV